MSKQYEKIKKYFDDGLWSKERVYNMVAKKVITTEEYELIIGKKYE